MNTYKMLDCPVPVKSNMSSRLSFKFKSSAFSISTGLLDTDIPET